MFERQIKGLCKPEDMVIGLTTSGTSPNINLALTAANAIGAYTVALTGRDGGIVKDIAALPIIIANEVRIDLVALDLIEDIAEINDSLNTIIQN